MKWAGGKAWFARAAAHVIERYVESHYFEPFLGGGALALALEPGPYGILSDVTAPLMQFWTVVRDKPGELTWGLSALAIQGVDEESYYRVRDMKPDSEVMAAARFFYLNRLGFNGLYRENKKGENNVPYGGAVYRKSIIGRSARDAIESLFPNKEKIHKASQAIKDSTLVTLDFEHVIGQAGKGDLVYADPPYDTTFDGYSKSGFGYRDQERLAAALYDAAARGATIVAHNALTENVRYWYSEWCHTVEVQEKRSVAANGSRRERAPCVVMTNRADLAAELGAIVWVKDRKTS